MPSFAETPVKAMKLREFDPHQHSLFLRGEIWYAKKMYGGKLGTISLHTKNRETAKRRAAEAIAKYFKRNPVSLGTVEAVLEHFEKHALHLRPSTIKAVHQHLSVFLNSLGYTKESAIEDVFTKDSIQRFFALRLKGKEGVERNRASITANSVVRNTRSLFSSRMLDTYPKLPKCVQEFRKAKMLPAKDPQYTVADKGALMRRLIERVEVLKMEDLEAYKVFWLALYCGLRRAEIAAARWDWITEHGLLVQPYGNFETKNGQSRLVPLSEDQLKWLNGLRRYRKTIVDAPPESRKRLIPERLGRVMREVGFAGSKTIHELRKYYGANVATQQGLFAAQKYLGHQSPTVTSQYYADLIDVKPVDVKIL